MNARLALRRRLVRGPASHVISDLISKLRSKTQIPAKTDGILRLHLLSSCLASPCRSSSSCARSTGASAASSRHLQGMHTNTHVRDLLDRQIHRRRSRRAGTGLLLPAVEHAIAARRAHCHQACCCVKLARPLKPHVILRSVLANTKHRTKAPTPHLLNLHPTCSTLNRPPYTIPGSSIERVRSRIVSNCFFKLASSLLHSCRPALETGSTCLAEGSIGQVHVVEVEKNTLDAACQGLWWGRQAQLERARKCSNKHQARTTLRACAWMNHETGPRN